MSYNGYTRDFVQKAFGERLPPVAPTNEDGSTKDYWVPFKASAPLAQVWVQDRTSRRSSHRIMARCPRCGFVCSFGRLAQHYKIHKGD